MNRRAQQAGYLYEKGNAWHVRWREWVSSNGEVRKVNRSQKLASVAEYPRRSEVLDLFQSFMANKNQVGFSPEATVSLVDFVERIYLPHVTEQLKPSTASSYRWQWNSLLRDRIVAMGAKVRDFRTVDAERLLQTIARENPAFAHTTFARLKSLLSGIFTHALRMGIVIGPNPISPISIPRGQQSSQTYAYSLEEIEQIIGLLPEPAKTVFAVAAFAGLRQGEIRGLDWLDYDGNVLTVTRSIWRKHVNLPKTVQSQAAVPVIKPLRDLLNRMRPHDAIGPIFRGELGRPLDLHNVARRVIRPTLALHGLTWHGFHAARRGLATNLHRLGVPDRIIQQILRHSSIAVTMRSYVKAVNADVVSAMAKLEEQFSVPRVFPAAARADGMSLN
jgi:integrase